MARILSLFGLAPFYTIFFGLFVSSSALALVSPESLLNQQVSIDQNIEKYEQAVGERSERLSSLALENYNKSLRLDHRKKGYEMLITALEKPKVRELTFAAIAMIEAKGDAGFIDDSKIKNEPDRIRKAAPELFDSYQAGVEERLQVLDFDFKRAAAIYEKGYSLCGEKINDLPPQLRGNAEDQLWLGYVVRCLEKYTFQASAETLETLFDANELYCESRTSVEKKDCKLEQHRVLVTGDFESLSGERDWGIVAITLRGIFDRHRPKYEVNDVQLLPEPIRSKALQKKLKKANKLASKKKPSDKADAIYQELLQMEGQFSEADLAHVKHNYGLYLLIRAAQEESKEIKQAISLLQDSISSNSLGWYRNWIGEQRIADELFIARDFEGYTRFVGSLILKYQGDNDLLPQHDWWNQ